MRRSMSQFDPAEFGKAMGALVREALAPVLKRLDELEGRDPVKDLLSTEKVETLISLEVASYLEENPPPQGEKGETGKDGRDGLDVKDLFRADGGRLVAVMSDGTTKDLGVFVGKDGEPGKDGADFSDAELDYDGDRGLIIRSKGAEIVKRLPIPMDRGYYRDGMKAEKGDILTHDGNAWLALKDTASKPCLENKDDWRIFARKGRDGRDGKDGKPPPGPVRLNADAYPHHETASLRPLAG